MEAGVACKLNYPTWIKSERFGGKSTGSLRFGRIAKQEHKTRVVVSAHFPVQTSSNRHRSVSLEVSCSSYTNFSASTMETGSIHAPYDEALMLKNKSLEVEPYLNGHSIYLVGLMGSGKTTVGKILSHVLSYSFCDSDSLIEQEVNGMSVAEIFKLHGESFFRKKEAQAFAEIYALIELLFKDGRFRWNRLEDLIEGRKDRDFSAKDALQPVLKLLLGPDGEELKNLIIKEAVSVTEAIVLGSVADT